MDGELLGMVQAVDPTRFTLRANGLTRRAPDEASGDRLDAATWVPILKSALDECSHVSARS
jgi:hypothetical protein